MNFGDLQESYRRFLGFPISTEVPDWQTQQIKDDLNHSLDEIVNSTQYLWHHVRESTFATVDGTSTYNLNDFCIKPLSFWTEDSTAHEIAFIDPREVDRNGAKNSNAAYVTTGPFEISWYPATSTAGSSAIAGSTGIDTTEGSAAVTKSGGTAWASTDVGKSIRINGEDMDFTVSAFTNANSITISRLYRARLTGVGQTGVGSALDNKSWEIQPPGIYRVQIRPTPTAAKTIYYRYVKRHSRMLNTDDVPDLPDRYHQAILDGAILRSAKFAENPDAYQLYSRRWDESVLMMIKEDRIDMAMRTQLTYASPMAVQTYRRKLPPDVYFRGSV